MASVDFSTVATALQTMLTNSSQLAGVPVYVEEDFLYGLQDNGSAVVIYAERYNLHPDSPLSGGKLSRWLLHLSIWCRSVALDIQQAIVDRDLVLLHLEQALEVDHTIGGTVATSWMEGGDLMSARSANTGQFMMSAETILIADVSTVLP